mmetsp:Transcript_26018/g.31574  ORF Transcript_26018/g.31574 Transcript_26018/m.31574 type:complete len:488 (+) Transcript_26018:119-1582(+)|eukprot:CAMPEP_0197849552 /NCGR_PEP_ID=MMETSP1438-20131217/12562_1 /TAXON_ID=1461541 /ORGANISM="Pterosperma sp., Strain CCMP1384" /LENGTH=487 /DNA_ID=CAMNT_0043462305 /DNA_START=115 /DNA_END=1578 /DNA_ORIENTATION=-
MQTISSKTSFTGVKLQAKRQSRVVSRSCRKTVGVATPPEKRGNNKTVGSVDFYPGIEKIQYEGPKSRNPLAFKHYNESEMVMGKTMKEWLRFSVAYWHTFRNGGQDPFGAATHTWPWDDGSESVENAVHRVDAAFEFFTKLGNPYYCFHDIDVAPEGSSLAQDEKILETVTDKLLENQKATGVKLLWATQNMFSHPRWMNGAATNPDLRVYSYAAAKTKMALEAGLKLGAENHVFWGGREGYQSTLNTDVKRELDHLAAFLHMVVDHKAKIGADYQLLIEPKPREPSKHQYDYDAQTVMGFLHEYGLQDHFKINVEPNHTTLAGHDFEHDILVSSLYGMLGSVDCNTGDTLLGWDTDSFALNVQQTAKVMMVILKQGGLAPGGLNFDCKVRRESTDLEDYFIAHIGGMDGFARALRVAASIIAEGELDAMIAKRYSTFDSDLGRKIEAGEASLEELAAYAESIGEPPLVSGKQELFENIFTEHAYNS